MEEDRKTDEYGAAAQGRRAKEGEELLSAQLAQSAADAAIVTFCGGLRC